jgi:hypothetical protein
MISRQIMAQMPIILKRSRLSLRPSAVALSALVAAFFLHGSSILAQSESVAGATESLYSSSATHESWRTVASSNDAASVAPISGATRRAIANDAG